MVCFAALAGDQRKSSIIAPGPPGRTPTVRPGEGRWASSVLGGSVELACQSLSLTRSGPRA